MQLLQSATEPPQYNAVQFNTTANHNLNYKHTGKLTPL